MILEFILTTRIRKLGQMHAPFIQHCRTDTHFFQHREPSNFTGQKKK